MSRLSTLITHGARSGPDKVCSGGFGAVLEILNTDADMRRSYYEVGCAEDIKDAS